VFVCFFSFFLFLSILFLKTHLSFFYNIKATLPKTLTNLQDKAEKQETKRTTKKKHQQPQTAEKEETKKSKTKKL